MRPIKDLAASASWHLSDRRQQLYWSLYYLLSDSALSRRWRSVTTAGLRDYLQGLARHPQYELIHRANEFSMLHEEVLALLYHLVALSRGRVVELGTYIGGATVVMARAAASHRRLPIIAVEPGGRQQHDTLPSQDILADLASNLERFGLRQHTKVLPGKSADPAIRQQVREMLGPERISLLVIDADGSVERDIGLYRDLLAPGAILVLDDYQSRGAPEKTIYIKEWVDTAIAGGVVESLGVWGWGTWIGRYRTTN